MIFEQTGLGTDASFTQAIWVGLTNLVFTVVAMLLIDKFGRKPLLLFGVTGIAISMFVLAYGFSTATYTLKETSINKLDQISVNQNLIDLKTKVFDDGIKFKAAYEVASSQNLDATQEAVLLKESINLNANLILWAIIAFVASFAVSLGPVMWVLFSELFPNRERGIAISFVGTINSIVSFSVQLVFPWELANLGSSATFMIYGLFAALGLIFIIIKVPETKGKSLEELEKYLITK
jgi:MFS family permease